MIKRLRVKFICINMALVMTMLMVGLCLLYRGVAAQMEKTSLAALEAASGSQMKPGRPGANMAMKLTFTLEQKPDGSVAVIGGSFFDLSDQQMVQDIYCQARDADARTGLLRSYSLRFYRDRGVLGDRYVFIDISAEQEALQSLTATCFLIGFGGFLGFLGISILLARWATRPVENAWDQQRQFVADASHELKTPLTVILTNAELLRSPEHSLEEKARFADSILEVSRQMRGLVENLLQLARADSGAQKLEKIRLDLSALMETTLLPFEPVYFERGLMLCSTIEPELFVSGEAEGLRQVACILLDNGQKYAVPGTAAELTLRRQGKKAVLRFYTPGRPMTQQQCEDIFKRFYRLDAARTTSDSYGMGLSIAQNIVVAHGGRIWAEPAADGNVFIVALPEVQ